MSLLKFAGIFTGFGLLIPIVFQLVWVMFGNMVRPSVGLCIENIMLMLWPGSIINLAGAAGGSLARNLLITSIAYNMVMYGLFGLLLWIGLNKWRWVLPALLIVVLLLWWYILRF
jgi:hypothetical protein